MAKNKKPAEEPKDLPPQFQSLEEARAAARARFEEISGQEAPKPYVPEPGSTIGEQIEATKAESDKATDVRRAQREADDILEARAAERGETFARTTEPAMGERPVNADIYSRQTEGKFGQATRRSATMWHPSDFAFSDEDLSSPESFENAKTDEERNVESEAAEAKEAGVGFEDLPNAKNIDSFTDKDLGRTNVFKASGGRRNITAAEEAAQRAYDEQIGRHPLGMGATRGRDPFAGKGITEAEVPQRRVLSRPDKTTSGRKPVLPMLADLAEAANVYADQHQKAWKAAHRLGYSRAVLQLMDRDNHGIFDVNTHTCSNPTCNEERQNAISGIADMGQARRKLVELYMSHHMDKNTIEGMRNHEFADKAGDERATKAGVLWDPTLPPEKQHLSQTGSHYVHPLLPDANGNFPAVSGEDQPRFISEDKLTDLINRPTVKHLMNKVSLFRFLHTAMAIPKLLGEDPAEEYRSESGTTSVDFDNPMGVYENTFSLTKQEQPVTYPELNAFVTSLGGHSRGTGALKSSGPGLIGTKFFKGLVSKGDPRSIVEGMSKTATTAMQYAQTVKHDNEVAEQQIRAANPDKDTADTKVMAMKQRARERVVKALNPALSIAHGILMHTVERRNISGFRRQQSAARYQAGRRGESFIPSVYSGVDPVTGRVTGQGGGNPSDKETRKNNPEADIPNFTTDILAAGKAVAAQSGTEVEEPRSIAEGLQGKMEEGLQVISRANPRGPRRIHITEPEIPGSVSGRAPRVNPEMARRMGQEVPEGAQIMSGHVEVEGLEPEFPAAKSEKQASEEAAVGRDFIAASQNWAKKVSKHLANPAHQDEISAVMQEHEDNWEHTRNRPNKYTMVSNWYRENPGKEMSDEDVAALPNLPVPKLSDSDIVHRMAERGHAPSQKLVNELAGHRAVRDQKMSAIKARYNPTYTTESDQY